MIMAEKKVMVWFFAAVGYKSFGTKTNRWMYCWFLYCIQEISYKTWLRVIRFINNEVLNNFEVVGNEIEKEISPLYPPQLVE